MTTDLKTEALNYHSRGPAGKMQTLPTEPMTTQQDLALAFGEICPDQQIEAAAFILQGNEDRTAIARSLADQHQPGGTHDLTGCPQGDLVGRKKTSFMQPVPDQGQGVIPQAQAQLRIIGQHRLAGIGRT